MSMVRKTIVDKILDELHKGTSLSKIRGKYHSHSALTTAMQKYIPEAETKIFELQRNLDPLLSQVKSCNDDIRLKSGQIKRLDESMYKKKESLQNLHESLEKIEGEITEREEVLYRLKGLTDRGISFKLIDRISKLEIKSGGELTSRIETVAAHEWEKKILAEVVQKRKRITKDITGLEWKKDELKKDKANLEDEILSKINERDEEEKQTRSYREAVKVTENYLKDGYSIRDLKTLRRGLKAIEVKGKPKTSISRYIESLQSAKTLMNLYDKIDESEKKLETLNSSVSKVESVLDAYKEKVLTVLDEAKEKVLDDIKEVSDSAKNETYKLQKSNIKRLNDIGSSHLKNLNQLNEYTAANINKISRTAINITTYLDAEVKRASNNLKNNINGITQQFIKDMEKYNKFKDQIRDQGILWKYGIYFLGVLKYPEKEIKEVPLPIIAQLMNRICLYTQTVFPDEKVYPSKKVDGLSGYSLGSLSTMYSYNLSALALFLSEAFEDKVLEELRHES